jgi:hypothetical protein
MSYTPKHHKDTPRTEFLVAELNAVDHREHFRYQRLLGHARQLERELATAIRALHRIAITDDEDCVHAKDPEAMKAIARSAVRTLWP